MMIVIELYKSALCPRCAYLSNVLKKLLEQDKRLHLISYDITTNMKAFKEANIKMIPTLKIGENKQSWISPKESEIKEFIHKNI